MEIPESLQPGDIFATKGSGIAGWATRNLLTPRTEVVDIGYGCVGVNIVTPGVAPIPNAFRDAELAGILKVITE